MLRFTPELNRIAICDISANRYLTERQVKPFVIHALFDNIERLLFWLANKPNTLLEHVPEIQKDCQRFYAIRPNFLKVRQCLF